jgi:hypothetical protein
VAWTTTMMRSGRRRCPPVICGVERSGVSGAERLGDPALRIAGRWLTPVSSMALVDPQVSPVLFIGKERSIKVTSPPPPPPRWFASRFDP